MTMTAAEPYFDMYDRDLYASPYEMYGRLRDEAPLLRNDELGFYAVSRAADAAHVLSDRDTFISGKGVVYNIVISGEEMPKGLFICEDPPLHTVHRSLISRLFTPRAVSRIEAKIEALFHSAADALVGRTEFDFMRDFAHMLPIQVIGMLLGLPEKDHVALRDVFHHAQTAGTAERDPDEMGGMIQAALWFNEYLDHRAEHPTDDLMTDLLNLEFEDETGTRRQLERMELLTFLSLITGAGSDTTVNAIGWAGSLLGEHPDQRRMLVDDPALIGNVVEEVLRVEPPAYHIARTAARDVELHGQVVPEGSLVIVLPGAANRDDRQFPDGDVFDIMRKPGQIFTFSFGSHFCLGASLARLETKVAIEAMLQRFPDWTVDRENAVLTAGIDTRGWDYLPVSV